MIVVSDTTPIISLLKISRLGLLEKIFGEVLIPNAVYEELTADTRFIEEAETVKNVPYIKSVLVLNFEAVRILRMATGLDQGESEAIVLADERKADILFMDEAKGRAISGKMGISIMGTIGSVFPSDQSLEKMLYLASENITKKWTQRYRGWDQVLNQLIVLYGERLTQHL